MSSIAKSNILVLGATGATGLIFTRLALKQSPAPTLTLFARSKARVPAEFSASSHVRIVEGALTDPVALSTAMKDVTTVISFLGAYPTVSALIARTKTTPIADAFPHVFDAMRGAGVKRIFALSTPAFEVPGEVRSWGWYLSMKMPPLIVPQGHAEMKGIAEQVAAQTDLDWTVFRVPFLEDEKGGPEKEVVVGTLSPEFKGKTTLSREGLCRWLLGEIEKREWVKKAPVLGNA
ncbi:NAD(P)-binding protein [Lophium mytilinum]|uniref:NAD(P)-binding protein n=1 Tax=Lophium mytilinum TaxID=390894 RepID=A0A6A6R4N7_9PEZI|nr:NAD(P)-binding protein [Lophium mytilinum]